MAKLGDPKQPGLPSVKRVVLTGCKIKYVKFLRRKFEMKVQLNKYVSVLIIVITLFALSACSPASPTATPTLVTIRPPAAVPSTTPLLPTAGAPSPAPTATPAAIYTQLDCSVKEGKYKPGELGSLTCLGKNFKVNEGVVLAVKLSNPITEETVSTTKRSEKADATGRISFDLEYKLLPTYKGDYLQVEIGKDDSMMLYQGVIPIIQSGSRPLGDAYALGGPWKPKQVAQIFYDLKGFRAGTKGVDVRITNQIYQKITKVSIETAADKDGKLIGTVSVKIPLVVTGAYRLITTSDGVILTERSIRIESTAFDYADEVNWEGQNYGDLLDRPDFNPQGGGCPYKFKNLRIFTLEVPAIVEAKFNGDLCFALWVKIGDAYQLLKVNQRSILEPLKAGTYWFEIAVDSQPGALSYKATKIDISDATEAMARYYSQVAITSVQKDESMRPWLIVMLQNDIQFQAWILDQIKNNADMQQQVAKWVIDDPNVRSRLILNLQMDDATNRWLTAMAEKKAQEIAEKKVNEKLGQLTEADISVWPWKILIIAAFMLALICTVILGYSWLHH